MNPVLIFKILSALYLAAKSPLVTKFMDNAVQGTSTKVDDWLWSGVKELLGTYEPKQEKIEELLKDIQAKYDADPADAKTPTVIPDLQNA